MKIASNKLIFNVKLCSSFFSKVHGFMFNNHKGYDGLLFDLKGEKSYSLHMLFVFLPLDIVYLDSNFKVLKILKNVKPFVPFIPAYKCNYILELKDCKSLKIGNKFISLEGK